MKCLVSNKAMQLLTLPITKNHMMLISHIKMSGRRVETFCFTKTLRWTPFNV